MSVLSNIHTDNLKIGKNVIIESTATIRGVNGKAKEVIIGDNTYIGAFVQIICDHFEIGDYSKIHHHSTIHGYQPCRIGHNAWIGQNSIIDSIGGTTIGNNCGIGAYSQLWSHVKYGDTLEGCRFLSDQKLSIGNDVWFVGHCIVSPITAEDKSMAMVGSVIVKDMKFNQIYAGVPAKSISEKIGFQFIEVSVEEKFERLTNELTMSGINQQQIKIVISTNAFDLDDDVSYFDVKTRTYTKKLSVNEIKFMKHLLPEKGKFIPFEK